MPKLPLPEGREAARRAVLDRMRTLGFSSPNQLASHAGIGYNSVNEWLKGRRDWPQRATRAAIELALGWEPGEIGRIAYGADWQAVAQEYQAMVRGRRELREMRRAEGLPEDELSVSSDSPDESSDEPSPPPNVVLDFRPGALEGLTEAEAEEVRAAATLAALRTMREIRASRADRSRGESERGSEGGGA